MVEDAIGYTNAYLLIGITLLLLAVGIFLIRRDLRFEIFLMTIIFTLVGIFIEPLYRASYLSSDISQIEFYINIGSIAMTAGVGAFASTVYSFIFTKEYDKKIFKLSDFKFLNKNIVALLGVIFGFVLLVILTPLTTLPAYSIAMFSYLILLFIRRRDLLADALYSGSILLLTIIVMTRVIDLVQPGWLFSSQRFLTITQPILGMSIDSIVFFFLFGCFVGSIFEYWQELRLVEIPESN